MFTKLINMVSLEQSHHKPMEIHGGGPLKLPLEESSGSSLPLEQCAITPQKMLAKLSYP